MSQNQKPNQRPKRKIEAKPEHVIIVNQPMVRNPRARVKTLDVSKAGKMPGVAYILTPQNVPKTYPLADELFAWFREAGLAARKARSPRMAPDLALHIGQRPA